MEQLSNLGSYCSTSSLVITVQTEADQANGPLYTADNVTWDFIEVVLGMEFDAFCLKFEAYAMGSIQDKCL
jgi:hypothetical protein